MKSIPKDIWEVIWKGTIGIVLFPLFLAAVAVGMVTLAPLVLAAGFYEWLVDLWKGM